MRFVFAFNVRGDIARDKVRKEVLRNGGVFDFLTAEDIGAIVHIAKLMVARLIISKHKSQRRNGRNESQLVAMACCERCRHNCYCALKEVTKRSPLATPLPARSAPSRSAGRQGGACACGWHQRRYRQDPPRRTRRAGPAAPRPSPCPRQRSERSRDKAA